jgi:hypothetical protein
LKILLIAALCTTLLGTVDTPNPCDFEQYGARMPDPNWGSGGAWHYTSVSCADTTITTVGPRLPGGTDRASWNGSFVAYATDLGFHGLTDLSGKTRTASVTDYGLNPIMVKERVGDKVQVCLISSPIPMAGCNPDKDLRGRWYRVFDYRLHVAYSGSSSEHGCGGA